MEKCTQKGCSHVALAYIAFMKQSLAFFLARRIAQPIKRGKFLRFTRWVAIGSVAIGTMALIISLSVLEGFDKALRTNATKFTSHIHLYAFGSRPIADGAAISQAVMEHIPDVISIAPHIEKEALLRHGTFLEGIVIKGVDPDKELAQRPKQIVAGRFSCSAPDAKEVIIGQSLAQKANLGIDSIVVVTTIEQQQGSGIVPNVEKLRIVGIYKTGMTQYEDVYVFMPLETSHKLTSLPPHTVTGFDIMVRDMDNIRSVAHAIENLLGYPYYAPTVNDLNASIFGWIEMQKKPIPIVLGLITIVAMLNVLTALLIGVVEKTHTIGVLRSIGMASRDIVAVFVAQGVGIGLLGTFLGCGLGYLLCFIQQYYGIIHLDSSLYYLDTAPIAFEPMHGIIVCAFSLFLSIAATFVPALIAVRITPVRALQFR